MKQKLLCLVLSLTVIAAMLSGCVINISGNTGSSNQSTLSEGTQSTVESTETSSTTESNTDVDYNTVYNNVLDTFYNVITSDSDEYDPKEGEIGVFEAVKNKGKNYALASVGYVIDDISGDNIPELLIVGADEYKDSICYGKNVYAAYTCVDKVPTLIFEGAYRSSYRILDKGKFLHIGSNGAMCTFYGTYDISNDGKELVCNDFYFTYEKDSNGSEIGYYHNTTGELDKSKSEEMSISADAFDKKMEDYISSAKNTAITSFDNYKGDSKLELSDTVNVSWTDALQKGAAHDEFITGYSDSMVDLLFTTDSRVNNFKVLSLEFEDVDSDGNMKYKTKELYSLVLLTNDYPLVFSLTIYGDLPSYGISYEDSQGKTKTFAVAFSGEDGSPMLMEIKA